MEPSTSSGIVLKEHPEHHESVVLHSQTLYDKPSGHWSKVFVNQLQDSAIKSDWSELYNIIFAHHIVSDE